MKTHPRRTLLGAALAATAWAGAAPAQDAYPSRPINLVIPFAPGGGTDLFARVLAESMRRALGQPITVQNVTGAGGLVGAQSVAQARPDGYTLLFHHIGMATIPALFPDQRFDPLTSLETIGLYGDMPMVVTARRDFAPRTMPELLAHVRQLGDRATIASVGQGGSTHLCAMMFQAVLGTPLTMVQFRGGALAMNEVIGGRVDLLCEATGVVGPSIQSGDLKPYALTADQRVGSLPEVPTTAELGIAGLDVSVWYGLYAPPRTPRPIIDRISAALQTAMRDPNVHAQMARMEAVVYDPARGTPEAHRAFLESELRRWTAIIRESGAQTN